MADNEDLPKVRPRSGDAEVLALAEGLLAALGKTFDRDGLETLKGVVDSYPEVGRAGAGEVVASLIGLLNDLLADEQQDKEALAVHIRAWRFMVSRQTEPRERANILGGLAAVRELYAPKAA